MRGALNEAVGYAVDQVADEPSHEPQAASEVADKYPVWIRLSILAAAIVLTWAVVVLFVMAVIGD